MNSNEWVMKMWLRIQVFSISASDAIIDNTLIKTKLCEHIVRILIVQVAYLIFIRKKKKKKKKHNQKRTSIVCLLCWTFGGVCVVVACSIARAHFLLCCVAYSEVYVRCILNYLANIENDLYCCCACLVRDSSSMKTIMISPTSKLVLIIKFNNFNFLFGQAYGRGANKSVAHFSVAGWFWISNTNIYYSHHLEC